MLTSFTTHKRLKSNTKCFAWGEGATFKPSPDGSNYKNCKFGHQRWHSWNSFNPCFSLFVVPCKTVGDRGLPCLFPFIYENTTYNSCTPRDSDNGQPWFVTASLTKLNVQKKIVLFLSDFEMLCLGHAINKTWPQKSIKWHQFKTWPQKLIKRHQK